MKIGALLRITEQPICSLWIDGRLYESTLEKLPPFKGALVVLIPSTQVLLTSAKVPSKQRQRVAQAVPYVLEDRLADEVEKLHFALGGSDDKGQQRVAVIRHADMQAIQQRLHNAGLKPTWIIPDLFAVPYPEKGWGLLYLGNLVLLRTDAYSGLALEAQTLKQVLPLLLEAEQQPRPKLIQAFKPPHVKTADSLSNLDTLGIEIQENPLEQSSFHLFAQTLQTADKQQTPINLRQGIYLHTAQWGRWWRPWRLTALLLLALLGTQIAQQIQGVYHLQAEQAHMQERLLNLYREQFPQAKKVINPRLQMQQNLQQLRSQSSSTAPEKGVLQLLEAISPALQNTPTVLLQRLDYRQQHLDLDIELNSLQNLEQLKQALQQQALKIEIRSASSKNNRVEAQLRIAF